MAGKRKVWVERQLLTARTRGLFTDLYRLYFELKRESETEEMIAANGFLRDRNNAEICHPVLTHRVSIDYDPDANTVFVRDTEIPSDLYSVVFQIMDDINLGEVNVLSEDLKRTITIRWIGMRRPASSRCWCISCHRTAYIQRPAFLQTGSAAAGCFSI